MQSVLVVGRAFCPAGGHGVCYLKAEVVAAGALAVREGPPGGEAAAAWAPGPAEHPSGAARLAGCPREILEEHLGRRTGCKEV